MSQTIDKPITIQNYNETTDEWDNLYSIHAKVNKAKSDNQYLNAGSTRTRKNLTFEVRYFKALEDISINLQCYRLLYQGVPYTIEDYDDYMEQHRTVKLLGVSY